MQKIRTIIAKEWAEVFKNRFVLFTVAFLPLVLTAIPLGVLFGLRNAGEESLSELPAQVSETCSDLAPGECLQVFLVDQFLLLFMLLPIAIPVTFAAYSIVGEKTTRSLEPLLATPITTAELLAGKSLAAAVPAILATWGGFVVFAVGAGLVAASPAVYDHLLEPKWLLAVLVVGPLLAILAVNVSMIVSSRASDPRSAEQLAMVVIVPLLGIFFAQLAGVLLLNSRFMLSAAGVLALLDVGMIYLGVRLFERETILTKWR